MGLGILRGGIWLDKSRVTADQIGRIKHDLTFENPFEDGQFTLGYRETGQWLIVPRNYLASVSDNDTVSAKTSFIVADNFSLRDYQKPACAEILAILSKEHSVVLTAKTGSGKSYSISYVLAHLQQRVLVLAHLSLLTEQLAKEMQSNTTAHVVALSSGMKAEDLGDVNIATFALLTSNPELLKVLGSTIGCLVIDECESLVTPTRINILYSLAPKYLISMSATPTKELVKQTPLLRYFIGNKVVTMEPSEESVVPVYYLMLDYTRLSWSSPTNPKLYKAMLGSFYRRSKILEDVIEMVSELLSYTTDGCIWIIVDRNSLQSLVAKDLAARGIAAGIINARTTKKGRRDVLSGIQDGSIRVLISSAPMSAGVSVPEMFVGIRILPHTSSDETLEQQVGRLKRAITFKKQYPPVWIDFAISGSLEFGGKKRFKRYKQWGPTQFLKPDKALIAIKNLWRTNA